MSAWRRLVIFPRAKHRLMRWCERQWLEIAGERIAKEIMLAVAGPGSCCIDPLCPDRIRFRQAMADADTARRVGAAR